MKVVYKYQLRFDGVSPVQLPIDCKIVHFAVQDGTPCIWAEITLNNPTATRVFHIYGTGHQLHDVSDYLFTTIDGAFVWHLYEMNV